MSRDEEALRGRFPGGLLYHGTISTHVGPILASNCLQPRSITCMEVTDKTGQEYLDSDANMVYLTTSSAPLYACSEAERLQAAGGNSVFPCIIEVDSSKLEFGKLYPDEDYVAIRMLQQELQTDPAKMPPCEHEARLAELQAAVKASPDPHRHLACESVDVLGSLAYRGTIPLSAITRISVMRDPQALKYLKQAITVVTRERSQFGLSELERTVGPPLTRWLIGDSVGSEEFPESMRPSEKFRDIIERYLAIKPELVNFSS